jgi:hypothetical protein
VRNKIAQCAGPGWKMGKSRGWPAATEASGSRSGGRPTERQGKCGKAHQHQAVGNLRCNCHMGTPNPGRKAQTQKLQKYIKYKLLCANLKSWKKVGGNSRKDRDTTTECSIETDWISVQHQEA